MPVNTVLFVGLSGGRYRGRASATGQAGESARRMVPVAARIERISTPVGTQKKKADAGEIMRRCPASRLRR